MTVDTENILSEMGNEVRAMSMYALCAGLTVPDWILETAAQAEDLETPREEQTNGLALDVGRAHGELTKLIDPATPDLVILLELESKVSPFMRAIGRSRLERSFMMVALTSTVSFVLLSLSHYLKDAQYSDFFTSSGWPLLVNEIFFISSAAIGASFSNLFQLDREFSAGTFLPKNQSSYWVRFILGIVAGLLLSTILNVGTVAPPNSEAAGRVHFESATLALMGGFSSKIVQRLIQRLIETLESILQGSAEQEVQARDRANKQHLAETLSKSRMRTALMLVDIQRQAAGGESPETLQKLIDQASSTIMSDDVLPMEEPSRKALPALPPATPDAPSAETAADANGAPPSE